MNIFKRYWLYLLFSLLMLMIGVGSLVKNGLRVSIDFTGGTLLEIRFPLLSSELPEDTVRERIGDKMELSSVQRSGINQFLIRGKEINNEQKNELLAELQGEFTQVEQVRFESVGPTLGRELLVKTVIAVGVVSLVIAIYVIHQFTEAKFGLSAVLAMLHDSLVLFGAFSLFGAIWGVEVDVLFVTALLTTLSFSVHDTIVVFDRIRELRRKHSRLDSKEIANAAVLETMTRSINNSLTIIIALLCLVVLGGETLRWFAVALLVGAITGTYSSPFVAVPLSLLWEDVRGKIKEREKVRT